MSLKIFLAGGFALAGISFSSFGATFPVTVNSDSGAGSLRQAISDANSTPGANLITFNIPGSGVHTISTFSALPTLTNSITIDGTTQPGYAGAPLIDLNGNSGSGRNGLIINTSNCVVRALILRNFGSSSSPGLASGILLTNAFGATIQGCYIGTTAAGSGSSGNSLDGIRVNNSAANTIGGTNSSQRNIISGNFQKGVFIFGAGSTGNQVMGNYIGPDVSGLVALGNGQNGILISNAANNVIGGAVVGAGNVISGNGYSGSTFDNLMIQGSNATGNVVAGNILGLKADFSVVTASPGFNNGVRVDNAPANTIGGTTAAARNYVGNNQFGILIINSNAVGNVIEGNYVGVSSNGTTAVPNHNGIFINTGASGTIVGAPGAGNLISGNQVFGLSLSASSNNTIQGNLIGTDATGMLALGNGASGSGGGMSVSGSGNLIGGTANSARNVISGNPDDGLDIFPGSTADSVNNLVQGNLIGVAADGVSPLGNGLIGIGGRGISILGASSNIIGGYSSGSANVIANNGYDGVWLARTFGAIGAPGSNNVVVGNTICSNGAAVVSLGGTAAGVTLLGPNLVSSNSIFANVYLGIDAGGDGPTANTPQGHSNFPVLTSVRLGSTDIDGVLDGTPGCFYTIEFYEDNPAFTLLYGPQGRFFLGAIVVPPGPFHASFFRRALEGDEIIAIATSHCPPIETSEFSLSFKVTLTPQAEPTLGTGIAVGGFLEAPVKSSDGENIVIKSTMDLHTPLLLWETIKVLAASATMAIFDPLSDSPHAFYRAAVSGPVGDLKATFVNPDGSSMAGGLVRIGRAEMPIPAEANGVVEHDGFPVGPVSLVLEQQTTVNIGTSSITYSNRMGFLASVAANVLNQWIIKSMLSADTNPPPPACQCTPWCGIMSGVVDGFQKVVAGGGANGSCQDTPVVQITGPGGLNLTLLPGQKRLVFDPAASGTWTVTSTVCGRTKTCQITVP